VVGIQFIGRPVTLGGMQMEETQVIENADGLDLESGYRSWDACDLDTAGWCTGSWDRSCVLVVGIHMIWIQEAEYRIWDTVD
jgi:hypothetical protein